MRGDQSLSFKKLFSIFAFLGIGIIAGIVLFLFEQIVEPDKQLPSATKYGADRNHLIDHELNKLVYKWNVSDRNAFISDVTNIWNLKESRLHNKHDP